MSYEIRGLRESELEAHNRLVYESYAEYIPQGRGFLADERWWLTGVENDPYYAPEQTRVMVLDGQLVSSVTCYQRMMYCGGALAKVGAIGSVATHPDHRRRGYAREVLREARQWMRDNGFDFSFLFGKYEVYGGSGWECLTAFDTVAQTRAPGLPSGLTVRAVQFPEDVPALAALYEAFNEPLVGPFVRTRAYWERRVPRAHFFDRTAEFRLIEEEGEPMGYLRTPGPGRVAELAWRRDVPDLAVRVLNAVLSQWPEQRETRFEFATAELLAALRPHVLAANMGEWNQQQGWVRLEERTRGLWTYIGPGAGHFPQITDTASLLDFLRRHEYVFYAGVDSF
jgi:GNAT superfamily N-acetyltransferase